MPNVLHVDRTDIRKIAETTQPAKALQPGQARLAIQSFALTANNVTYAASGDAIGYWHFFPTGIDGQGIVPVWGTAVVTESCADGLDVGARLYGFWPMGEELVIQPDTAPSGVVTDAALHRAKLPPIYNRYYPVAHDAAPEDDLRAIFQPLLATSWLIADWLSDNGYFGAEQIIIGSASSKTGLGLCRFLAQAADRPSRIVGLTSSGNTDFVSGLGDCDAVISYDDLEDMEQVPSVYVDMAGNTSVKQRLHAHLGRALKFSSAVGLSHWDNFRPKAELSGPKPQFFFAPAQAEKRRADWGGAELDRRISGAWKAVANDARNWMTLQVHQGLAAAIPVYQTLADGSSDPATGHVVHMTV